MYLIYTIQALLSLVIFLWTQYILNKKKPYKILALIFTAFTVVLIFITIILILFRPDLLGELEFKFLFFVFCGILMVLMIIIKIQIFIAMYNKSNAKKKIIEKMKEAGEDTGFSESEHPELSTLRELYVFLGTLPVFLFAGAYFTAKILLLILFDEF